MPAVFLIMAGALGVSSFACGLVPLSASYSKKHLDILNALSTGLLLGTALGIIIPEGIEVLAEVFKDNPEALGFHIAVDLLIGFLLMMVVEHLVAGDHGHSHGSNPSGGGGTQLEFDAELGELESDQNGHPERRTSESSRGPTLAQVVASAKQKAIPFTIGLIIHGIADGCALGVSALEEASSQQSNGLSLIVFLALLFHKGEDFSRTVSQLVTQPLETTYSSVNFILSSHLNGVRGFSSKHESSSGRLQKISGNIRRFDPSRGNSHLLSSNLLRFRR
ncbi:hypothetical protein NP233_g2596 [Leucocoprinus birnbaumii]|uniref:Uncharacterized protein n=1 Tax=Leucocoprinus birnbaumii TaxID=56174 RepID=A0AAD5VXZ6_9AGAR|nr:hypothetical protein NP233_g2596 [Leucocoprinus birnbaumii]